jgi:hypothetical protein
VWATQSVATEGCQPAFDRDYQVRLSIFRRGKGFEVCVDPDDCPLPYVAVYFDGTDDPILESTGPGRVAQVKVTKGSSLGVDLLNDDCALELTADRLRAGGVTCSSQTWSAHLSMVAMPL